MKNLLIILLFVVGFAAAGYGLCSMAGWAVHERELITAAVICALAGGLAIIPAVLSRRKEHPMNALAQAALIGTVLHMFLIILLAAAVTVARLAGDRQPFLFWLLTFYWASLLAVVLVLVSLLRQASPRPAGNVAGVAAAQQHGSQN